MSDLRLCHGREFNSGAVPGMRRPEPAVSEVRIKYFTAKMVLIMNQGLAVCQPYFHAFTKLSHNGFIIGTIFS